MRNSLFTLFVATALSASAQSGDMPTHEVSFAWGGLSAPAISTGFGFALTEIFSGEDGVSDDITTTGSLSLQYLCNLNRHFAVGATLTYEHLRNTEKAANGKYMKDDFISIMPTVRAYWFNKPHFGMYSRMAVGITLDTYTLYDSWQNEMVRTTEVVLPAFQISPIGLEAGSRNVRAFAELGIGFQGFALIGLKYGF